MFGTIIRHLMDQDLTTVAEIEEATGRSTSTVYRWMNDEVQPQYVDVRRLVRELPSMDARRKMVDLLMSDLPVVIDWLPDDEPGETAEFNDDERDGHEVVGRTLLALDCLTELLSAQHRAIRRQELTRQQYGELISLLDDTMRHLATSRRLIESYHPDHQSPPAEAPDSDSSR